MNSYKRYVPNSFAPTANTAAVRDRAAAFRVTGEAEGIRIEKRLEAPVIADATLPENPVEAIQALEASEVFPLLFGSELANDLTAFARAELQAYFREVTDWERQAYLEQV